MAPKPIKFTFATRLPERNLLALPGFRTSDVEDMLNDILQLLNIHEIVVTLLQPMFPRLALEFQEIVQNDMEVHNYTSIEIQAAVRLYLIQNDNRYSGIHELNHRFHAAARTADYLRGQGNINAQLEAEVISMARLIHARGDQSRLDQSSVPTIDEPIALAQLVPHADEPCSERRSSERLSQRVNTIGQSVNSRAAAPPTTVSNDSIPNADILQQVTALASRITFPSSSRAVEASPTLASSTPSQEITTANAIELLSVNSPQSSSLIDTAQGSRASTKLDTELPQASSSGRKIYLIKMPRLTAQAQAEDVKEQARDPAADIDNSGGGNASGDTPEKDNGEEFGHVENRDAGNASNSDDNDQSDELEVFKEGSKNAPGPKNYDWETLEGHVHAEARRGRPEPSMFVILLRGTHRTTKKRTVHAWSYQPSLVLGFDWNNGTSVSKLNRWRTQVLRRATGVLAHDYRESWTEMEAGALHGIIHDTLQNNGNDYYKIDWDTVSKRLNDLFREKLIPKGSKIAVSSTNTASQQGEQQKLTKGGLTIKDRVGSNRNSNACKNQAEKLQSIRALLDAARATSSRSRKPKDAKLSTQTAPQKGKKRKGVSKDDGDSEEEDAGTDIDYDNLDNEKKGEKGEEEVDESPRGPTSKRPRYFY